MKKVALHCNACDKRRFYDENERFCSLCGTELVVKERVEIKDLLASRASETPANLMTDLVLTHEQAERLMELLESVRVDVVVTEQSAWVTAFGGVTLEEL